ncbi:membrane protein [Bifidobacterium pullorum]|uniref:Membrane protein n=1 Tax=Bifidobacterium pullorum TaxID=78448 RepID=A0A7V8HPY4_9BIFI|nr:membrane protein [Bifidobacterium pullorum]
MNADKPANGGGKPSLNAVIRAIRDWFAGALHVLAHKVWPAVRSFTTRMVGAIGRALRRGAAQLGPIAVRAAGAIRSAAIRAAGAIARAARHLVSLGSQVIGDLRPSATSADPAATSDGATSDGVMSAGNAKSSAANNAAKSSAGTAHVYLVRRIVVFGLAALIVLAIVLGIVFGVRALGSNNGAGADNVGTTAQSQTAGNAADQDSASKDNGSNGKGNSDKDADAETQTDGKDDANTSDQQSAPEPLTDDERAAILSKAEQTATESGNELITYTYCVASKGEVGDLTEFSDTVFSTLNDPRGWPRAGAVFQEADGTDPNACSMTLTLAAADQMTSFSTECSDEYSCRVGNDVVINVDRWNNATEGWLNAGGTVSRYRTMVINHEVGHRLGHLDNELTCSAVNQPAPLMQQQSMDLLGCTPNEWPLDEELWVSE